MSYKFSYNTSGTCSKKIDISVNNDIIESVKFHGGCPGNLAGIGKLVPGMKILDVIERVKGIRCGSKSSSCPDQLAKALQNYLDGLEEEISPELSSVLIC